MHSKKQTKPSQQPVGGEKDRTFWYQEVMKQRDIVRAAHTKIYALEDEIRVLKFDYEQKIAALTIQLSTK